MSTTCVEVCQLSLGISDAMLLSISQLSPKKVAIADGLL